MTTIEGNPGAWHDKLIEETNRVDMKIKRIYVLAAILVVAAIYFYQDPGWNGNSRLDTTKAIVEHGSVQIDAYVGQPDWATRDISVYQGHYYTEKGIGSSLFAVPAYFLLYRLYDLLGVALDSTFVKHILTALVMGASFTINGVVLYLIAQQITANSWKAAIATLGVSLGTMLWPYSAVYYGHVPAAMFVAIAFYLLMRFRHRPQAGSHWRFFWAGLAMGLAFMTDYTTGFIIAGLIVYSSYSLNRQKAGKIIRSGLAGSLGAMIPLAIMVAYNIAVYGSILTSGYSYDFFERFREGRAIGFMGIGAPQLGVVYHITLDPRFGMLWQSPVLILAAVGYFMALRARSFRAEALMSVYAIASLLLMNSGYFMWWGGSAFGPRFLIVALPFFIVPLALVPDGLTWLLGGLTILSAGQMLIPLLGSIQINVSYEAPKDRFLVSQTFHGFSIMYQYGIPLISRLARSGSSPWTLGSALGLPVGLSAAVLVGVEAFLAGLLYRMTRQPAPDGEANAPDAKTVEGEEARAL